MPATMSASARLTSSLVSRSRLSASSCASFSWGLVRRHDLTAADQFNQVCHDRDEPVVLLPNAGEHLNFVAGDELQSLKIMAELVGLAQRAVKSSLIGRKQRGGDPIKLARRIMLDLPV